MIAVFIVLVERILFEKREHGFECSVSWDLWSFDKTPQTWKKLLVSFCQNSTNSSQNCFPKTVNPFHQNTWTAKIWISLREHQLNMCDQFKTRILILFTCVLASWGHVIQYSKAIVKAINWKSFLLKVVVFFNCLNIILKTVLFFSNSTHSYQNHTPNLQNT